MVILNKKMTAAILTCNDLVLCLTLCCVLLPILLAIMTLFTLSSGNNKFGRITSSDPKAWLT